LNCTTMFDYDGVNKIDRVDANSSTTSYTYDARNRLSAITNPQFPLQDGTFAYDASGNLLSYAEPGRPDGVTNVSYTYDALNRVQTEISAGQAMHQYMYDANGNRRKIIFGGTGRVQNLDYDALNRLNSVIESGRSTTYQYDLNGNQTVKRLPNGEVVISAYDPLNRLLITQGLSAQ